MKNLKRVKMQRDYTLELDKISKELGNGKNFVFDSLGNESDYNKNQVLQALKRVVKYYANNIDDLNIYEYDYKKIKEVCDTFENKFFN